MQLPALRFYHFSFFWVFFIQLPAMPGQLVQLGYSCSYSDRPGAFFHELTKQEVSGRCWRSWLKVHGCQLGGTVTCTLSSDFHLCWRIAASFFRTVPKSLSCRKLLCCSKKISTASIIAGVALRTKWWQHEQAPARQAQRSRRKNIEEAMVDEEAPRPYSHLAALTSAAGSGWRRKCWVARTIFALPGNQGFCAEPVESSVFGQWFLPAVRVPVRMAAFRTRLQDVARQNWTFWHFFGTIAGRSTALNAQISGR